VRFGDDKGDVACSETDDTIIAQTEPEEDGIVDASWHGVDSLLYACAHSFGAKVVEALAEPGVIHGVSRGCGQVAALPVDHFAGDQRVALRAFRLLEFRFFLGGVHE